MCSQFFTRWRSSRPSADPSLPPRLLAAQKLVPLTRYEAYALASMVADCRVSQVVDVRKGVHCMVPKSVFVKTS